MLGPTLALAAQSLQHAGDVRQVALVIGALMVLGWVRAADLAASDRRRAQREARRARAGRGRDRRDRTGRAPRAVRGRGHPLAALVGGRDLPRRAPRVARACSPGRRRSGSPASRSSTRAARRPRAAALWERKLDGARRLVLPNFDALRTLRGRLPALALSDGGHAAGGGARGQRGADRGLHRADVRAVGHAAGADRARAADPDAALVRVAAPPHRRHRALLRRRGPQPGRARAGAAGSRRGRRLPRGAGAAVPAGGLPGAGVRVRGRSRSC